jgi:hypothetical protein
MSPAAFAKIFSQCAISLLVTLTVFFTEETSILTKSDLPIVSYVNCAFGSLSKFKPMVT